MDKVADVAAKVDEVQEVMAKNIELVLKNTDRIHDIEGKSGALLWAAQCQAHARVKCG